MNNLWKFWVDVGSWFYKDSYPQNVCGNKEIRTEKGYAPKIIFW